MKQTIVMSPGAVRDMIAHAKRAAPRECCGLIVGRARRVMFVVPMRNRARGRSRYRIDPAAHIALQRFVRAFFPPAAIIGVYHSHPRTLARPSPLDLNQAFYPDWVQCIVSLASKRPVLRAFRIAEGRVHRVRIVRRVS